MNILQRMAFIFKGLLISIPLVSFADTTVNVQVTVQAPPPCVINDDKPIEVNFGDVMTTKVDGNNYRQLVNYTLSCTEDTNNDMKMQVQGTGAGFSAAVLQTNQAGLGIALLHDGERMAINEWLTFTYPNLPALGAVPVKQDGVTLSAGEFTAGATLKVDYQ